MPEESCPGDVFMVAEPRSPAGGDRETQPCCGTGEGRAGRKATAIARELGSG